MKANDRAVLNALRPTPTAVGQFTWNPFLGSSLSQSMTYALAAEYAKQGIRFTAVQPDFISSGMTDGSGRFEGKPRPRSAQGRGHVAVHEAGSGHQPGLRGPEMVALVIAMLASEGGRFITGTEVRVDGGTHF